VNPIKVLVDSIKSMIVGFKYLFIVPRMTLKFPEQKMVLPPGYRGQHYLEMDKCAGCGICAMSCPPRAITLVKREPTPRNKRGLFPLINFNYCIYCGFCVLHCPFGAIHELDIHDLAVYDRDKLIHPPEFLHKVKENPEILYEYSGMNVIRTPRWKEKYAEPVFLKRGVKHEPIRK